MIKKKKYRLIPIMMLLILILAGFQQKTESTGEGKETNNSTVQTEKEKREIDRNHLLYGHDIELEEIGAFNDLPFSFEQIVNMSIQERNELLSLGKPPDLVFGDERILELEDRKKQGKLSQHLKRLTEDQLIRLLFLGYDLDEIQNIPQKQLDYLFPIEDLKYKLYAVGVSGERMRRDFHSDDDVTYKDFILLAMSQPSEEEFINQAEEKNIYKWERDALIEKGFTRTEILKMSKEERAKWLTPGSLDNLKINPSANRLCYSEFFDKLPQEAIDKGITKEMAESLVLLGYLKSEMAEMSQEELDFIFPLTELRGKLNDCGFSNREITVWERRLKYIIRECLGLL